MTRQEKIKSLEESIRDIEIDMMFAEYDNKEWTKLYKNLIEAERQLKELAWIEEAEEFYAGL